MKRSRVNTLWTLPAGALLLLSLAQLVGCSSATWNVIQSVDPSPYSGQPSFSVKPVAFGEFPVDGKSEQEYKAELDPKQLESWEKDKEAINANFIGTLTETAKESEITVVQESDSEPFEIRPVVMSIETGYYRIPAFLAVTKILLNITIVDRQGEIQDEIEAGDSAPFDVFNPSTGGRLRTVANSLGEMTAEYLAERVQR